MLAGYFLKEFCTMQNLAAHVEPDCKQLKGLHIAFFGSLSCLSSCQSQSIITESCGPGSSQWVCRVLSQNVLFSSNKGRMGFRMFRMKCGCHSVVSRIGLDCLSFGLLLYSKLQCERRAQVRFSTLLVRAAESYNTALLWQKFPCASGEALLT